MDRVDDELRQSWNWMLKVARDFDVSCDNDRTWPPPILTALVAAVHDTTLRRLHPFTSHARLCLSSRPHNWEPGVSHAPAFVSLDPDGHYNVWSGDPYTGSPTLALETDDAKHAAAEVERLLAAWV